MQEYSAGFTSERLVKNEMKLVIQLYLDGKTKEEIRDLVIDENLFNMRSIASIKETLGKINRRINFLDDTMMKLYVNENNNDSSAILLYTFLTSFRIAREFAIEVIYDKWNDLKKEITIGDINIFLEEKAKQSDIVSNWTEATTKRIRNRILEFCTGCGLLQKQKTEYGITPIVISKELKLYIENNEDYKKISTYTLTE
jgi:hypothetical protein